MLNGTTYFYVVTASGLGGESGPSNEASATPTGPPPAPPAPPSGLVAVGGSGQVTLTWNPSSGAVSYNVYRGTVSGGPYKAIDRNISLKPVVDKAVSVGTTYFYVVTANGPGGESGYSNQASAVPGP